MSEYVDVAIIENGKVIGSFKALHKTEEKKNEMKNKISMALKDPILQQGFEVICKENAELRAAYDKQKEINKELADDIGALQDELKTAKEHMLAANKAYDALAAQIRQANEREAQDIRARFPC